MNTFKMCLLVYLSPCQGSENVACASTHLCLRHLCRVRDGDRRFWPTVFSTRIECLLALPHSPRLSSLLSSPTLKPVLTQSFPRDYPLINLTLALSYIPCNCIIVLKGTWQETSETASYLGYANQKICRLMEILFRFLALYPDQSVFSLGL